MNKPSQIFGDPKQGLRDVLARIIRDFDSKSGAFAGLKYNSPWILATEDWAERSGHTVEELCEMILNGESQSFLASRQTRESFRFLKIFAVPRKIGEPRQTTSIHPFPTILKRQNSPIAKN
ncbi:hypothetical protein [Mesorhizobium sp. M0296]|uniref:hypothetical protein n=1 Tax=Mesorhizobium sp. M0296 TaxID=2956931 RepID=UPI0033388278